MAESVQKPEGKSFHDPNHDKGWSFADVDELRLHYETGGTVTSAATLLYRTFEEVRQKAIELGLIK